MADGGKTKIGRSRVRVSEPVFEEDDQPIYGEAAPIFVANADEDEYEDEPDEVEEDEPVEVDEVDEADDYEDEPEDDDESDEEDADDEQESSAEGGLTVEFAHVADGTIRMVIHGEFSADIVEGKDGGKTIYNSTEFGGAQTTLKRALESVGRNTIMRAVSRAWDAANPKEKKKPAAPRSATGARIDALEAALAQSNANMAEMLRLLSAKAGGSDDSDEQEEPAAPKSKVRIARN